VYTQTRLPSEQHWAYETTMDWVPELSGSLEGKEKKAAAEINARNEERDSRQMGGGNTKGSWLIQ
jgi:hypothetical protein